MSLSVADLRFSYGEREILRGVNFTAEKGELLAVLGPNGAGKSTLFRCILGALEGYSGTISVDGTDLRTVSVREKARHIAYIPQSHHPTAGYTVLDTALMGLTRQMGVFSQPKEQHIRLAMSALERLGIEDLAQREFSRLSGGEQQLVLIARAMTQQAQIMVMDEPTSSLDFGNQLRVMRQIRELTRRGYTVLLSTHNPQHALSFADRVLALYDGGVAAFGAADEVLTADLLKKLYHVDANLVETPGGVVIVPRRGGEDGADLE